MALPWTAGSQLANLILPTSLQSLFLDKYIPSNVAKVPTNWKCEQAQGCLWFSTTNLNRTCLHSFQGPIFSSHGSGTGLPMHPTEHHVHSPRAVCTSYFSVPVLAKCLLPWCFLLKHHSHRFCDTPYPPPRHMLCLAFSNDIPVFLD